MNILPIKSEKDYKNALNRLYELFEAKNGTKKSDEADILSILINDYEQKYHFIDAPDPIEAIKIRMEEMNIKQIDLVPAIGGKSSVSEILNKKRKLTIDMIRNLANVLNLSPRLLITDYQINK